MPGIYPEYFARYLTSSVWRLRSISAPLVDGDLITCEGLCKTVLSPVYITQPDSSVQLVEIYNYPIMGEAESDVFGNLDGSHGV
jgi:hypothetical protein